MISYPLSGRLLLPAVLALSVAVAAPADRHPELKSRPLAWTAYDGSFLVDPRSRAEMMDFYWNVFAAPYPDIGWTGSLSPQVPGEISERYRLREYAQLNAYRALNYSQPMQEDASKLPMVQAGALVLALNPERPFTHYIDSTWVGYNELAREACLSSEIGANTNPVRLTGGMADGFIFDNGAINAATVGHRSDLLHDATVGGAIGLASNGEYHPDLWHPVFGAHTVDPSLFVAWPAPGYVPYALFRKYRAAESLRWSFALASDHSAPYAKAEAVVTARVNGVEVPVRHLVRNEDIDPITWDFDTRDLDLRTSPDGTTVEITVSNITGVPVGSTVVRSYRYTVTFFDEEKSIASSSVHSPVTPLINLSTRGTIGSGNEQMIAGFWITGTLPVRVALRTQGPGLARLGVTNPAKKTRVRVYSGAGELLGENAGWREHPDWRLLHELGLTPATDDEAGMVLTLWPGPYTAIVSDELGSNGTGLVEVFNIDNLSSSRLLNLSTRGVIGPDALIAGFIIKDRPRTIVVRTQGPGLAVHGLTGLVADTTLSVVAQQDGREIARNDDWADGPENVRLKSDLRPFAPSDPREAALVVTLPPGAYTAVVGAKGGSGLGLVELFDLEP
ncbi:hypothetical protein [Opitutus sp. ER46]|uniref:hypothetical protein n=1 Tax=Opitutus sp. ER46 TaxID=2161864 RepID=UPI000D308785|nr:hypothetical protein [Opitutus sp. ER46]PTX98467.1 hypothetical protein DB354_04150 [Opitutus sp. ER46]